MPFFHATWVENLPSILKSGLGGSRPANRNFPDAVEGVYLCLSAEISIGFLIEHAMTKASQGSGPAETLARMRVIVVDDSRIDRWRLKPDPQIDRPDLVFLYDGTIDVSGMPVLEPDMLFPNVDDGALPPRP